MLRGEISKRIKKFLVSCDHYKKQSLVIRVKGDRAVSLCRNRYRTGDPYILIEGIGGLLDMVKLRSICLHTP